MFAISINDGFSEYYFSGWERPDAIPCAGSMTFWRKTINDIEVYEFTDIRELKAEIALIKSRGLNFTVGIDDEFVYADMEVTYCKVREHDV